MKVRKSIRDGPACCVAEVGMEKGGRGLSLDRRARVLVTCISRLSNREFPTTLSSHVIWSRRGNIFAAHRHGGLVISRATTFVGLSS